MRSRRLWNKYLFHWVQWVGRISSYGPLDVQWSSGLALCLFSRKYHSAALILRDHDRGRWVSGRRWQRPRHERRHAAVHCWSTSKTLPLYGVTFHREDLLRRRRRNVGWSLSVYIMHVYVWHFLLSPALKLYRVIASFFGIRRTSKRFKSLTILASIGLLQVILYITRMWANAQRDGRPVEYRWRPLFNAAKFGWHSLVECRAVTLRRRETRWN